MKNDFIVIALLVFIIILLCIIGAQQDTQGADPYEPEPEAYTGLTIQEIEDLERERQFAMDLDKHIESQYQERVQPSRSKQNRVLVVEATAYTHTGNNTFSGVYPKAKHTIAVDPNVIPLGSKVKIDGHIYKAEDTGGDIKGNKADIFMDTRKEAIAWGRREVTVEVVREGY